MTFLESLGSPANLRRLSAGECEVLAKEIRDYLITTVSGTGGHLGPNLGVVELTIGLHRTFDSPRDTIIFDVGHQTYVHKLLTGRREEFPTCGSATDSPATRAGARASTTSSRTPTPRPPCPGLTASPRLASSPVSETVTSSPSSVTEP